MNEIENNEIKSIFFDLSRKSILPKYKNLKDDEIKIKGNNDIYTVVDIIIEKKLKKILNKLLPGSLFVGEESYSNSIDIIKKYNEKKYCWTVDPLDGTKNFVKGIDRFAVMLSLSFSKQILQSWIYKPLTDEFSYAIYKEGAFINNKKIIINRNRSIDQCVGSISLKYWDHKYFNKMKKIKNDFLEIKSLGCIAFEYIDIIKSLRDFAILSKLSPWDHLPGILLLREAGGFDSYFDNGNYNHCLEKKNLIVASNAQIGNKITLMIKE